MTRGLRFASLAIFAICGAVALSPRPQETSPPMDTSIKTPTADPGVVMTHKLTRDIDPRIEIAADAIAGVQPVELSKRTRESIQIESVHRAIVVALETGDFSPESFGGSLVNSMVDSLGTESTRRILRSYRPQRHVYRAALRAVDSRNRSRSV